MPLLNLGWSIQSVKVKKLKALLSKGFLAVELTSRHKLVDKPEVDVAVKIQESFQDIQNFGHLGEEKHSVASGLQLLKQFAKNLKLSTGGY